MTVHVFQGFRGLVICVLGNLFSPVYTHVAHLVLMGMAYLAQRTAALALTQYKTPSKRLLLLLLCLSYSILRLNSQSEPVV